MEAEQQLARREAGRLVEEEGRLKVQRWVQRQTAMASNADKSMVGKHNKRLQLLNCLSEEHVESNSL